MAVSADFNDDHLYVKGVPVLAVVDTKNRSWYKGLDVANALGYANASYLINKHVSPRDKSPFKDIPTRGEIPIGVDGRNIFVNVSGLRSILSSCGSKDVQIERFGAKPKPAPVARPIVKNEQKESVPKCEQNRFSVAVNSRRLQVNGCPILHVVGSDGVKWFKANDIAAAFDVRNTSYALSKHVDPGDRMALREIDATSSEADPRCIFVNSSGLKSFLSAFYPTASTSQLRDLGNEGSRQEPHVKAKAPLECPKAPSRDTCLEKAPQTSRYIVIKSDGPCGYEMSEVSLTKLNSLEGVKWKRAVSSRKLYDTLVHLLSPWSNSEKKIYHSSLTKLVNVVTRICDKFNATQMFVNLLLRNYSPSGSTARSLSDDEVTSLANKVDNTGRLGWIYIVSNDRYAARHIFKVGSTKRLTKRLNPYNTGRIEEDFMHYYWAERVFDCQKIDNLVKYFLNEQSQKIKRPTELYTIDFQSLKNVVAKIVEFYETSLDMVSNTL